MARLKSREHQIPGGFKFRQEEIKWDSTRIVGLQPSFTRLVDAVIAMRRGNQFLAQQNGWSLDRFTVENEIEQYNVRICESQNWNQYLIGGDPIPKTQAPAHGSVAVGVKTISEWLGEGGKPVEAELAQKRADVCAECPLNSKGDWTRFFTAPASAMIRKYIEAKNSMKLATTKDEELGICSACACPMKVKVWTPLPHILKHLSPDTKEALKVYINPDTGEQIKLNCWILSEAS